MKLRLLQRCIVALAALATLVSPAWGPIVAHAGGEGRTLLMAVCTSQGGVIRTEIPLTSQSPSDKDKGGECHHCPLCVPGADRPLAGPVPAGIAVPVSLAAEAGAVATGAAPAAAAPAADAKAAAKPAAEAKGKEAKK